jgi:hypothetical protein
VLPLLVRAAAATATCCFRDQAAAASTYTPTIHACHTQTLPAQVPALALYGPPLPAAVASARNPLLVCPSYSKRTAPLNPAHIQHHAGVYWNQNSTPPSLELYGLSQQHAKAQTKNKQWLCTQSTQRVSCFQHMVQVCLWGSHTTGQLYTCPSDSSRAIKAHSCRAIKAQICAAQGIPCLQRGTSLTPAACRSRSGLMTPSTERAQAKPARAQAKPVPNPKCPVPRLSRHQLYAMPWPAASALREKHVGFLHFAHQQHHQL